MQRGNVRIECSGDEIVLALLSIIQITNPAMLRAGSDGFAVDLTSLEKKPQLSPDELLLVRLHEAFATGGDAGPYPIELSPAEATRLCTALEILARARQWPPDMERLNDNLCSRLQN